MVLLVQITCSDAHFEPITDWRTQEHADMMKQMTRSTFCLVLPGNSQSTQGLTEAIIAGCIPAIVGPPWHALPFPKKVRQLTGGSVPAIPPLSSKT